MFRRQDSRRSFRSGSENGRAQPVDMRLNLTTESLAAIAGIAIC